jgi:hypothetical protein
MCWRRSPRASGEVDVEFFAAGERFEFTEDVDSENRRVRFERRIPADQADLGTGIMTITYGGDEDTRPQEVRLRAASQPANLELERPVIADGRLTAEGTVSDCVGMIEQEHHAHQEHAQQDDARDGWDSPHF